VSAINQNACTNNNTIVDLSREQKCINALQEAKSRHHKYLSKNDYEKMDILPCSDTIIKIFDGWSNAKKAAKLPTKPSRGQYDEEDCINSIINAESILGHSPSIREYDDLGLSPSRKVIKRLFGKWNIAIKSAGFNPNTSGNATSTRMYTKEDCIESLNKASNIIGRSPTREEYDDIGLKPSYYAIIDILDSFNKAKKKAGLKCYNEKCSKNNQNDYGSNWYSIRQSVFEVKCNKCKSCGISRKENINRFGHDMPVHHIIPYQNFESRLIGNHISNLIPLCHSCHGYLESKPVDKQCSILDIKKPIVKEYQNESNPQIFFMNK
jgi:hypothetical protein